MLLFRRIYCITYNYDWIIVRKGRGIEVLVVQFEVLVVQFEVLVVQFEVLVVQFEVLVVQFEVLVVQFEVLVVQFEVLVVQSVHRLTGSTGLLVVTSVTINY